MMTIVPALADIVQYSNFELRFPLISLEVIIWGMYGGILLACIISIYCKKYEGEIVRRLLKRGADSPQRAMTISELGLKPNALRRRALRGAVIRKYIRFAPQGDELSVQDDELSVQDDGAAAMREAAEGAEQTNGAAADTLAAAGAEEYKEGDPLVSVPLPKELKGVRLYIPAPLSDKAYFRYEDNGGNMAVFFATAAAFLVLAVLLTVFVPELVQMLDNLITFVK